MDEILSKSNGLYIAGCLRYIDDSVVCVRVPPPRQSWNRVKRINAVTRPGYLTRPVTRIIKVRVTENVTSVLPL